MSFLINELDLSGRLQYFHFQSLARDFGREQVAAIRRLPVSSTLHLPTEMSVLTAMLPTYVGVFGGTFESGEQWMVTLERAPASEGDPLDYFYDKAHRIYGRGRVDQELFLSDEELRSIYSNSGAAPTTDVIGFTSLLLGLQAEAFGYSLRRVVDNMNAQCAFPEHTHECEGSFYGDIGSAWMNQRLDQDVDPNEAFDEAADFAEFKRDVMAATGLQESASDDAEPESEQQRDRSKRSKIIVKDADGLQCIYFPVHGDEFSPGEVGWILTSDILDSQSPQQIGLPDVIADLEAMGLGDESTIGLAIALTEEMARSLRGGRVAAQKHPDEPTAAERLTQIESELAAVRERDR